MLFFSNDRFLRFLTVSVFLLYFWTIIRYSANVPYWDDYQAVLLFINDFFSANANDKISLLFSQHNEHRIVFNRVVQIFLYKIFGRVDFIHLIILGNIGWVLTIYLLWHYCKGKNISYAMFFPVVVFMLSFSHYELMTWGMASLQQYYQVLFSLLALYFLDTKKYTIALFFMAVSLFTGSGAVVLFPIFLIYLLLKKEFSFFVVVALVELALLIVFFVLLNYSRPGHHPSILASMESPVVLLSYFLSFLGSFFGSKNLSIFFGFLSLLSLIYFYMIILKNKIFSYDFVFLSLLFCIFSALITALARSGFGVDQALSSRYSEYSLLFVSLLYVFLLLLNSEVNIIKKSILLSLGYVFSFIVFFHWFGNAQEKMKAHYEGLINGSAAFPDSKMAEQILKKSYDMGYFKQWRGVTIGKECSKNDG